MPKLFIRQPKPSLAVLSTRLCARAYSPLRNQIRTMLDINLFRADRSGNPDLIRESQRRRNAKVELVDEVIQKDREWLKRLIK